MAMNILLLGSGGREHALAWKMATSPLVDHLYCAPGNPGISREARCVALDPADHAAVIAFCRTNRIDFCVVGPVRSGMTYDLEIDAAVASPLECGQQIEAAFRL
jgi:phosphoribosylamine---glycine ligase